MFGISNYCHFFQLPDADSSTDGFCWECDYADIDATRFFDLTKGVQKLKFIGHFMGDHDSYVKKNAKVSFDRKSIPNILSKIKYLFYLFFRSAVSSIA